MPRPSELTAVTHSVPKARSFAFAAKRDGPCRALAEGLERGEALHGIEELGAEFAVGPGAFHARLVVEAMEGRRQDEGEDGSGDEDGGDRQIEKGDEGEDGDWGHDGDQKRGKELAEIGLELLHAVDHREHDIPGALLAEPGGAQDHGLVVNGLADGDLDTRRRLVGDHDPDIFEETAGHHHAGDDGHRHHQFREGTALEHQRDQPAQAAQGERRPRMPRRVRRRRRTPCGRAPLR